MATIHGRKHTIRRGYLLVPQEMTGPGGKIYTVDLEYQVFDAELGTPVLDFTGTIEGELHGSRLVVGDPHRDTRLHEYTVDTQPTSESNNYWRGYQAALGDRQWHKEGQSKKYYGNTQAWWDGYNDGHRNKRDPSAGYAPNARKRAPFTDGPRGTEHELTRLRRDQDLVQQQLEMAHRQGNTKAIARLREMERDLDRRVDEVAFEPNARDWRITETQNLLMSFFREHGAATAADALRAVPMAKRRDIDRLTHLRFLISAPSPGRGNMLRVADSEQMPNGGYYVWVLASDGTPKDEGPYGPKDLESAKTYARIAATRGAHDRAVSRGLDPKSPSFEVVRRYERGTGERIL